MPLDLPVHCLDALDIFEFIKPEDLWTYWAVTSIPMITALIANNCVKLLGTFGSDHFHDS